MLLAKELAQPLLDVPGREVRRFVQGFLVIRTSMATDTSAGSSFNAASTSCTTAARTSRAFAFIASRSTTGVPTGGTAAAGGTGGTVGVSGDGWVAVSNSFAASACR